MQSLVGLLVCGLLLVALWVCRRTYTPSGCGRHGEGWP